MVGWNSCELRVAWEKRPRFDCSCSRASFQENHQYHSFRRRAFIMEAKVAVGKNKATKATPAITTGRAVCNARFLLREVHVSGALSGACAGKGPQMANRRPTPQPENFGKRFPSLYCGTWAGQPDCEPVALDLAPTFRGYISAP